MSGIPKVSAQGREKTHSDACKPEEGMKLDPFCNFWTKLTPRTRQSSLRGYSLPLHTAEPPQIPVTPRITSTHLNMDLPLLKTC